MKNRDFGVISYPNFIESSFSVHSESSYGQKRKGVFSAFRAKNSRLWHFGPYMEDLAITLQFFLNCVTLLV